MRLSLFSICLFSLPVIFFSGACNNQPEDTGNMISDDFTLETTYAYAGMEVILTSFQFSSTLDENEVFFNGTPGKILFRDGNELYVQAPEEGSSGPVTVTVEGEKLNGSPTFTYYTFSDAVISGNCNTGTKALSVSDIDITKITRSADRQSYIFHYEITITNNGSESVNLNNTTLQAYLSTDASKGNENDVAAGGAVKDAGTVAPGETTTLSSTANSSLYTDGLAIGGSYLFLEITFDAISCTEEVSQIIDIPTLAILY